MASFVIIFLIFYLPLLVVPQFRLAFEFPKVVVAEVAIELLLILKILQIKGNFFKNFNQTQLILSALLIILSIIDLFSGFSSENFFGNVFRLQGVVLLWHLIIFSIIVSSIKFSKIPTWITLIPLVFLFSSIFVFGQNSAGRAVGTLGEPNSFVATAVYIFPFLIFNSKKIYQLLAAILTLIILFFAQSYSGLIAFLIEILFILLIQKLNFPLSKSVIVCLSVIGLSLLLPFSGFRRDFGAQTSSQVVFENRSEIWQTAFAAGLKKPIFGWGFSNIQTALNQTSTDLQNNIRFQIVDSSHNFLLDYWVEGGIAGLTLILIFLYTTIKNLISTNRKLELTVFLGVITAMLFNPVSIGVLIVFWWILGHGSEKDTP